MTLGQSIPTNSHWRCKLELDPLYGVLQNDINSDNVSVPYFKTLQFVCVAYCQLGVAKVREDMHFLHVISMVTSGFVSIKIKSASVCNAPQTIYRTLTEMLYSIPLGPVRLTLLPGQSCLQALVTSFRVCLLLFQLP